LSRGAVVASGLIYALLFRPYDRIEAPEATLTLPTWQAVPAEALLSE